MFTTWHAQCFVGYIFQKTVQNHNPPYQALQPPCPNMTNVAPRLVHVCATESTSTASARPVMQCQIYIYISQYTTDTLQNRSWPVLTRDRASKGANITSVRVPRACCPVQAGGGSCPCMTNSGRQHCVSYGNPDPRTGWSALLHDCTVDSTSGVHGSPSARCNGAAKRLPSSP